MTLKLYNKSSQPIADIAINDDSQRYAALCGDDYVTLKWESADYVNIEQFSYVEIDGTRYTLLEPVAITCEHSRKYKYEARFEGARGLLRLYRFINPVDKRVKFSLTAKPHEHLQMLIDNLAPRNSAWAVGECVDGAEKVITYDYLTCREALELMAQTFDTEWEVVGNTISLRKVSYDKDTPIALSYGKGKGFVSGVARKNVGNARAIDTLYAQGGERNIDPSKYKSPTLLLPKSQTIRYDGMYFEGDLLFDEALGIDYATNNTGTTVTRLDTLLKPFEERSEGVLDCTEIYPQREGVVTEVILRGSPDKEYNHFDIVDDTIPMTLDYEDYRIAGENMTIVFQSGMLAGKEFSVNYVHTGISEEYPGRRFEIISQEYDGVMMPSVDFAPVAGDKYAIFGTELPEAYVCDNVNRSGASWDMLRKCVRHLYDNERPQYTFSGKLDPIYVQAQSLAPHLKVGAWVSFTDRNYQREPMLIRITSVKGDISNPNKVEIGISEKPLSPSTRIQAIASNAKIDNAILAEAKRAKRDNLVIKALTTGMGSDSLERKVGILIGDDFDMSARAIASDVVAENMPTEVATATHKMTISAAPAKNTYMANVVYEWLGTPVSLTIQSLTASNASYENVWTIRFGCTTDTSLLITPSVLWKDGVAPQFEAWGVCELRFTKQDALLGGNYLGEWKIYR